MQKTYQGKEGEGIGLDWDAAISFVSKCKTYLHQSREMGQRWKIGEDLFSMHGGGAAKS